MIDKAFEELEQVIDQAERGIESIVPLQRSPGDKLRMFAVMLIIYVLLFVFLNIIVGFIGEHSPIPIPPPDPAWGWFAWYQIFIFLIEAIIPLGMVFIFLRRGGFKVVLIAYIGFAFFFGALVDFSWSFVAGDINFWLTGAGITGDPRFWVHPFTWAPLPCSGPMIWWLAMTRFLAAGALFYVAYRLGKHHIALTNNLPIYHRNGMDGLNTEMVCYRSSFVSDVDYDVCKPVSAIKKEKRG